MPNGDASGSKENLLLPHLRLKKEHAETTSKGFPIQNGFLPPHLRALKQRNERIPVINASANYYASLDPKYQSSFSHNFEQPKTKATSHLHAVAENSPHIGSIQSSSRASSDASSMLAPNEKEGETVLKASPALHSVSLNVIALEQQDDKKRAFQSSLGFRSKSFDVTNSQHHHGKPPLQTGLASSFLDKWGSKGRTVLPKASIPSDEKSEDFENQLVFKAWPGQVMRSRPGNAPRSPLPRNASC